MCNWVNNCLKSYGGLYWKFFIGELNIIVMGCLNSICLFGELN
jgi:hypothetical protein